MVWQDGVVWLLDEPPDPSTFDAPGWSVRALGDGPSLAGRALLVGAISGSESAVRALEAASRGAALAVHVDLAGVGRQRFLEDLARLGVRVREGPPDPPRLTDQQVELLELLAAGSTVTAAAAVLNVSRRTTNRMLEEIRGAFGVESTAQAVRAWAARSDPRSG